MKWLATIEIARLREAFEAGRRFGGAGKRGIVPIINEEIDR